MTALHRRYVLIEAPVDEVWAIVSDPKTHPEWWPEVVQVEAPDQLPEGGEFTRYTRRLGFLDLVDAVWVAERLEHLKEAHFRCTVSGTYARFALTQARDDTFVELEAGMLPTSARWRVMQVFGGPVFRRWVGELLAALSDAVGRRTSKQIAAEQPPPA